MGKIPFLKLRLFCGIVAVPLTACGRCPYQRSFGADNKKTKENTGSAPLSSLSHV
jgi:hypothetical protein